MNSVVTLDSVLALLLVAGLLVLFFYALTVYRNRFLLRSQGDMQICEQLPVGPRQRLLVVKMAERKLLLAISQEQITLLESWNDVGKSDS